MTVSIAEALHQAQEAINGGDYASAADTCGRLVTQFPSYATAYQLLGEAYREQGHHTEAERAFAAALARDQRHPAIYLGLGLIAEDQGPSENALAFCQVAWELAPNLGHLRENLTRVAMRRFGMDGQLQYSRAALAQLHVSASRLRRAIDEYRAALAELPDRVDLQLGLAESLWRIGQDGEAGEICRTVLEQHAESAPALVILTDIERRAGGTQRAADLLKRLRAVDPDGAIAASMIGRNPRADRGYLELPVAAMPDLSVEVAAAPVAPVRIAPAPDFSYQPSRLDAPPAPSLDALAPMSFEDFGGAAGEIDLQPLTVEELGGLPEDFQPISPEEFGGTASDLPADYSVAASIDRDMDHEIGSGFGVDIAAGMDAAFESMMPSFEEPAALAPEPEPAPIEDIPTAFTPSAAAQASDLGAGFEDFSGQSQDLGGGFEDFSEQPFVPTQPSEMPSGLAAPSDFAFGQSLGAGLDESFDQLVESASAPATPEGTQAGSSLEADLLAAETPAPAPVADDAPIMDLSDLAASLEGDIADALSRAGEPVAPPPDPGAGRSQRPSGSGYTTMLRSLDNQGLEPFDPHASPGGGLDTMPAMPAMPAMPEPPPVQDDASVTDEGRQLPQTDEFGRITRDWDTIDDEIAAAVPEGIQRGYTDQLRSLDEIGLAPFEVEEPEDDLGGVAPFNPFGAEAAPAAPPAPAPVAPWPRLEPDVETEEDIELSSMPTAPLQPRFTDPELDVEPEPELQPQPAPAPSPQQEPAAAAPDVAAAADEDLLGGLEPFAFEEFDGTTSNAAPAPFSFGQGTIQSSQSGSAVPSDADLEALLAFGDEPMAPAKPAPQPAPAPVPVPAPMPEPKKESDLLQMVPGLTEDDLDPFIEGSVAVTRELDEQTIQPRVSHTEPAPEPEPFAPAAAQAEEPDAGEDDIPTLRPGTELFTRARRVKAEMMSDGLIGGNRELAETSELSPPKPGQGMSTAELEDITVTARLVDEDEGEDEGALGPDDDFDMTTGSSRDTRTLRAALEATPDDDELHWWLAEALRERGEMTEAYAEYRWIIRAAPERHEAVMQALTECVERDQEPETAHRLLGDIYRRRGDVTRASNHAALALQYRRRGGRVR